MRDMWDLQRVLELSVIVMAGNFLLGQFGKITDNLAGKQSHSRKIIRIVHLKRVFYFTCIIVFNCLFHKENLPHIL